MTELIIQNESGTYKPVALDGVTWTTERRGSPGKLTFSTVADDVEFGEGNVVRLSVGGHNAFLGYIFSLKRDKQGVVKYTAYDQLRYFANKDTFVFKGMTASEIIRKAASDFKVETGELDATAFRIANLREDNASIFDVVYKALDFELTNNKKMFVLYDDFGKLALKSLENMKLDILIDAETGENFEFSSSIDNKTYNQVKLSFNNEETGKRDIYMTLDSGNIGKWGLLQYFEEIKEGENGQAKADALLSLYNEKTRELKIRNAVGDPRVRGGSLVVVKMDIGELRLNNYMLVEQCAHNINNGGHFMNLTLRGGKLNG